MFHTDGVKFEPTLPFDSFPDFQIHTLKMTKSSAWQTQARRNLLSMTLRRNWGNGIGDVKNEMWNKKIEAPT